MYTFVTNWTNVDFIVSTGKYTAYPTGELHVRDVDEHDARRTYQCVIYPKSHLLSSLFNSFSGYGKKFGSNTNELHYHQQQQSSRNNGGEENYVRQTKMPVESTFAQIILSGMYQTDQDIIALMNTINVHHSLINDF